MACDDPACGGCTGRIKNTVTTLPPELRRKVNAWYFASLKPAGDPPVVYHEDAAEEAKLYRVAHMPGRGRAMFAARDINVGEVVLSEKPVVTMSDQAYDEPDFEFRVSKQVWNLEPAQVAHFMDLGSTTKSLARFFTNCMGVNESVVILDGSYFNHSCRPNIVLDSNDSATSVRFRAARQISKGEELCFSYIGKELLWPKAKRQGILQKNWAVKCLCTACSTSSKAIATNDAKRQEIANFLALAEGSKTADLSREDLLEMAERVYRFAKDEDLVSLAWRIAQRAYAHCPEGEDSHIIKRWSDRTWECGIVMAGADDPALQKYKPTESK